MRLTLFEIETIVKLKNRYFSEADKIYLFGSRVDDTKKGGDIDLYIDLFDKESKNYQHKLNFIADLQEVIGEQKIDLIVSQDESRLIEKEAKKGIELDVEKIKLQKYFNECDKHLQRIEEAYSDIEESLPLTVEKYQVLSKDEVQDIDQYLYRFSKLQDTLGQKIFRLIVNIYEPSSESIPFLDLLHKLEKLGCLVSSKEWISLREKRNKIAHQYDDEPYEMTEAINDILNQKEIIKAIYKKMKQCSQSYFKAEIN